MDFVYSPDIQPQYQYSSSDATYSPVSDYSLIDPSPTPWSISSNTQQSRYYPYQLPLHAPVPLPRYSSLLARDNFQSHALPHNSFCHPESPMPISEPHLPFFDSYSPAPPQKTFPTPCELLTELAANEQPSSSSSQDFLALSDKQRSSESQRKTRRRAMTQKIGFEPTDPDRISSHDKKRHYLECLEQYVLYLHEQLALVGAEPVPLERVSSHRGLSSRSIRTLLVHMETTTKKLNLQTIEEEHTFLALRDSVLLRAQEAAAANLKQGYVDAAASPAPYLTG